MCVFVLSMILISATVLSRLGPAPGQADAACGIAWVQGCSTTAAAATTHTAHSTTKH
jgi:hypothetical protein